MNFLTLCSKLIIVKHSMWIGLTCVSCKIRRLMMMVVMVIGFNIKGVRLPLRPQQTESGRAAKLEQCVDTEGIQTERSLCGSLRCRGVFFIKIRQTQGRSNDPLTRRDFFTRLAPIPPDCLRLVSHDTIVPLTRHD